MPKLREDEKNDGKSLMLEIPDYRSFSLECAFECCKHFPDTSDTIVEQMTDRLIRSIIDDPKRTMKVFEVKTRCHQLLKSLKELER